MAMSNSLNNCLNCDEKDDILECKGCSKKYCFRHLLIHREEIQDNLNKLQDNFNIFKENLNDSINNYSLIKQINQWEIESIEKNQTNS